MESSSSTSKEIIPVPPESKEDVSTTAEDTAKAEKFVEDLEKIVDKYGDSLAACCNVNDKICKTTVIESVRGYSTLLKEMEKPISKSVDAYIHFEQLLNDPLMMKNDNDKVTKARLIYHEYWSLLFETSKTVNKILVASKRAIKAIDLYELEIECETIPDMSTIDTCLNRVTSWNEACKSLNVLQSKFETLGKLELVDDQRQECKKMESMEQDLKNKFTKSLRSAAWFFDETIENIKDTQTYLQNKMANKSQNNKLIQAIVQSITQDFGAIKKDIKELNNAFDECIKHVEKCKKEIVDAVDGK